MTASTSNSASGETRTAPPSAGASRSAEAATLQDAYRSMVRIRHFEDEVQRQFLRGNVHGTTHLCNGQEAVSVGVLPALGPDDVFAATYRGHGHALAAGVPLTGLAAELMGRATGTCGGRSGSMNVIDRDHGLLGCFGIVGGSIAAATGAALALKGRGAAAVAFFGEGAANQGYFAECLNFARVLSLPAIFVCENNLYGEYTPWEQVTAGSDICARVRALDIPAQRIDGNDVRAVQRAATATVQRVRAGGGPAFLECMTYRVAGHSRSDPGLYRKEGELEQWRRSDPLVLARAALIEEFELSEPELSAIEIEVAQEVGEGFQAALAAPFPLATAIAHA